MAVPVRVLPESSASMVVPVAFFGNQAFPPSGVQSDTLAMPMFFAASSLRSGAVSGATARSAPNLPPV